MIVRRRIGREEMEERPESCEENNPSVLIWNLSRAGISDKSPPTTHHVTDYTVETIETIRKDKILRPRSVQRVPIPPPSGAQL